MQKYTKMSDAEFTNSHRVCEGRGGTWHGGLSTVLLWLKSQVLDTFDKDSLRLSSVQLAVILSLKHNEKMSCLNHL